MDMILTAMKMPPNWTDISVPETRLFNSGGNHSAGGTLWSKKKVKVLRIFSGRGCKDNNGAKKVKVFQRMEQQGKLLDCF